MRIFLGILTIVLSVVGLIIGLFGNGYLSILLMGIPLLFSILSFIVAKEKKWIKVVSIACFVITTLGILNTWYNTKSINSMENQAIAIDDINKNKNEVDSAANNAFDALNQAIGDLDTTTKK